MLIPEDHIAEDCAAELDRRMIAQEVYDAKLDAAEREQREMFMADPAKWLLDWADIDLNEEIWRVAKFIIDGGK